jgi:hypothetical protein
MLFKKCSYCGAKVREDRLDKHVKKVHLSINKNTNQKSKKTARPQYELPKTRRLVICESENELYEKSLVTSKSFSANKDTIVHKPIPYSGNLKDSDPD